MNIFLIKFFNAQNICISSLVEMVCYTFLIILVESLCSYLLECLLNIGPGGPCVSVFYLLALFFVLIFVFHFCYAFVVLNEILYTSFLFPVLVFQLYFLSHPLFSACSEFVNFIYN